MNSFRLGHRPYDQMRLLLVFQLMDMGNQATNDGDLVADVLAYLGDRAMSACLLAVVLICNIPLMLFIEHPSHYYYTYRETSANY